jgi:hypothetical protein
MRLVLSWWGQHPGAEEAVCVALTVHGIASPSTYSYSSCIELLYGSCKKRLAAA